MKKFCGKDLWAGNRNWLGPI